MGGDQSEERYDETGDEPPDEIMASPEWAGVDAVKNGRVYTQLIYSLMDGLSAVPGLLWLEQMLHEPRRRDPERRRGRQRQEVFFSSSSGMS